LQPCCEGKEVLQGPAAGLETLRECGMAEKAPSEAAIPAQRLERGLGLTAATSVNVLTMMGAGPFISMPLLLHAMRGPQAMLGWICGALIALCDGLVWAEFGAALPESGGGYRYLLESFGSRGLGQLMSFLLLWQYVIVLPLLIASAAVGFAGYAIYLYPAMTRLDSSLLAVVACLGSTFLIYRRTTTVGRWSVAFGALILGLSLWILVEGVLHARPSHLTLPPDAFSLSRGFWLGLGSATLYAMYDYLGYQTVGSVGAEIREPQVTIPRSIVLAISSLGVLYLALTASIIGVIPWPLAMRSTFVLSDFADRLHGKEVAALVTAITMLVIFAGMTSLMLGTSRIPYAAAEQGRFFSQFARLHPHARFPSFSVLYVGLASALCCFFALDVLIQAGIVLLVMIQSLPVVVGLAAWRRSRPDHHRPYRMWLYPLPLALAFCGWTFILMSSGVTYVLLAFGVLLLGVTAYLPWARHRAEWPWPRAGIALSEQAPD
jgi:amino acid transporter